MESGETSLAAIVLAFNASDPTWHDPAPSPPPVAAVAAQVVVVPPRTASVAPPPPAPPPVVATLPPIYRVEDKAQRCLATYDCPVAAKHALDKHPRAHRLVRTTDGVLLAHRVAIPAKVLEWMSRAMGG